MRILATLGPTSMTKKVVQKMDSSGVDIFRVNLSHTRIEDFAGVVRQIRSWTTKPLCIDSEGAQIRTGRMRDGSARVAAHTTISLVSSRVLGTGTRIPLYPVTPSHVLVPGDVLCIDFDSVVVQVISVRGSEVLARVLSPGVVGSNKGVSLDREVDLPTFTAKDLRVISLAAKLKLNYFALSFARSKHDVDRVRSLFPYPIFLISKIESSPGLRALKETSAASDAILIDRGDLSRDVPIQKIGLAQKHILDTARELGVPVYVATNLLETMVKSGRPSRAEINDITSTLLSGASGLVLAAETAIGNRPVESVRMVADVIRECGDYGRHTNDICSYLGTMHGHSLIAAHGGELVQHFASPELQAEAEALPRLNVDDSTRSDIAQIGEGVYSPLRGFMNGEQLESVLTEYRLPGGPAWTMPILLQLRPDRVTFKKEWIVLATQNDSRPYGIMKVTGIERIDLKRTAKKWFGTDSRDHPGVAQFLNRGDVIVSGDVFMIQKRATKRRACVLTPRQTRRLFADFGWRTIVGFHTRNVVHRGHEFIQKKAMALVNADALFISPVVGAKRQSDFSAQAILKSYEVMLKHEFYKPYPVVLGGFDTYSRYSGPREAVFTALCRQNFGCSHFIVGRDHTGVGSYYSPDASQELLRALAEEIEILPILLNAAYYCARCKDVTDNCRHTADKLTLSGTLVREHIARGGRVPAYLMRKEVARALRDLHSDPHSLLETL